MLRTKGLTITIMVVAVALIAAIFFSHGSLSYSMNKQEANFCKNCHQMNPNIQTWQLSSHSKVGCIKCHDDINLFDFGYRHWLGWYDNPVVASKNLVSNETCTQCHSPSRPITASRDIIMPHELHLVKKIDCTACHSGVTHSNISTKLQGKSEEFIAQLASTDFQSYKNTVNVPMNECLRCHNGNKAANNCKACHFEATQDSPAFWQQN